MIVKDLFKKVEFEDLWNVYYELFMKDSSDTELDVYNSKKSHKEAYDKMIDIVPEPDPIHEGSVVPCAFITLNTQLNEQELRKKINTVLGEKMANYVNLNSIHILDELPHIGIGKVDLQKLEQESYRLSKRNN